MLHTSYCFILVCVGCPSSRDDKIVHLDIFENITIFLINNNVTIYCLPTRYQAFCWLLSIGFLFYLRILTILTDLQKYARIGWLEDPVYYCFELQFTSCS